MGWGEQHNAGAGTTGQIEDAHRGLDAVQVRAGPLAVRALEAAGIIDRLRGSSPSARWSELHRDVKPFVYVSGPITGDPFGCVRMAAFAWRQLCDTGCVPFLPQLSVLHQMVEPQSYEDWLAYDFDIIRHCQAVVRLPGETLGADRECEFAATSCGLPVFRLPDDWAALRVWAVGD